jgi:ribulose kinase
MSDAQVVVYLLVGLMALCGTVGTAVLAARQKGLSDLVTAQAKRIDQLEQAAEKRDARIERLERRDRAWADYVHALRKHIEKRLGPPPPEWPADLDV